MCFFGALTVAAVDAECLDCIDGRDGDEDISSVKLRETALGWRVGEVWMSMEFEGFRGEEVVGVIARTVEGDLPRGDSGRRKGDERGELKARGAGRRGVFG